ncbi:hypothetical protein [uncultured Sulfitobacter sp.]|uniref:hypothetical protein n=1 Tax=uncultured Sulfitobacter sp. TaxID=191468 RepID=UPI00260FF1D2|nr:hypothetical protein [uncultured Sulfitobacter sp.]
MRFSLGLCAALFFGATAAHAADPERIQVKGEVIDTWCYYSGVMGGPDAVVGTAHHTCALWCSAGGIPVGILGEDGEVYMVLKVGKDDQSAGGDTTLKLASYNVTADGMLYERDGIKYIVVADVIAEDTISNLTHEDYGPVPGFAIPEPK